MIAIVYASRAAAPMGRDELTELLHVARERNGRSGVTGMLLYVEQSFLQQIEGEDDAVDAIYESIVNDPRHHSIRQLERQTATRRRFPDWSMGFEHPDQGSLAQHLVGYRRPVRAPLVSSELVHSATMARALLDIYAGRTPATAPRPARSERTGTERSSHRSHAS